MHFINAVINPIIDLPHAKCSERENGDSGGCGYAQNDFKFLPHKDCIKKNLVIFLGGAGDSVIKIMYRLAERYKAEHVHQDIYYRTHNSGAHVVKLIEAYHAAGRKIAVIGHSWGGSSAVHAVAMKTGASIDILSTLDPVGRFQNKPTAKPFNVACFINVYINYSIAERFNINNFVARIGGPWENVPCATENHDCNVAQKNFFRTASGKMPDHAWAEEMFSGFVKTRVENLD